MHEEARKEAHRADSLKAQGLPQGRLGVEGGDRDHAFEEDMHEEARKEAHRVDSLKAQGLSALH